VRIIDREDEQTYQVISVLESKSSVPYETAFTWVAYKDILVHWCR